jgi:hypothetical protein
LLLLLLLLLLLRAIRHAGAREVAAIGTAIAAVRPCGRQQDRVPDGGPASFAKDG